jgi:hypothetical protein
MWARINLFVGWFFVLQIFINNVLAEIGFGILTLLGMPLPLGEKLGWLVGAVCFIALLFVVRVFFGELPPGVGKKTGNGYKFGHGLILFSSLLAIVVYVVPFFIHDVPRGLQIVVVRTTVGMLYPALGMFVVGVSFIYQSALPVASKPQS